MSTHDADAPPDAPDDLQLAAAAEAIAAGGARACLARLPPPAAGLSADGRRRRRQLEALCHTLLAARGGAGAPSWLQLLGLDGGPSGPAAVSAAGVRRQYRRLAALIHPDKLPGVPCAAEAFQALRTAAEAMLDGLGGKGAKRARPHDWGNAGDGEEEEAGGESGSGDDDWMRSGGGFPWWSAWDGEGPATAGQQPAEAAAEADDDDDDDDAALERLGSAELADEVRRRQAAILQRPLGADGRLAPLAGLNARLRRARSALSARQRRRDNGGGGGDGHGFVHDVCSL